LEPQPSEGDAHHCLDVGRDARHGGLHARRRALLERQALDHRWEDKQEARTHHGLDVGGDAGHGGLHVRGRPGGHLRRRVVLPRRQRRLPHEQVTFSGCLAG